jgi:predicted nucleotidyltransferase
MKINEKELRAEIRKRLFEAHQNRLRGIVLYGSLARGRTTPQSDIDLLVLLDEPINYGADLERNIRALYPLSLQIGKRISPKPVAASRYEHLDCPLYINAHREGIAI